MGESFFSVWLLSLGGGFFLSILRSACVKFDLHHRVCYLAYLPLSLLLRFSSYSQQRKESDTHRIFYTARTQKTKSQSWKLNSVKWDPHPHLPAPAPHPHQRQHQQPQHTHHYHSN